MFNTKITTTMKYKSKLLSFLLVALLGAALYIISNDEDYINIEDNNSVPVITSIFEKANNFLPRSLRE